MYVLPGTASIRNYLYITTLGHILDTCHISEKHTLAPKDYYLLATSYYLTKYLHLLQLPCFL